MTDASLFESSLQDAQELFRAGRLPEAARLYHEFLRANPRHFEALDTLGIIYFQMGQFEQAQYLLGEALRIDPFNVNGRCLRGVALMHQRRYAAAIECFDQALSIKPDFVEALSNRATALLEMNRVDEALAGFEQALTVDSNHAISWNNRGNAQLTAQQPEEAIKSYDMALAIRPDFVEARDNRQRALFQLRGTNSSFAEGACAKGVFLMRERRFEEAIMAFDEALEVRPDFVEAMSNRATALAELKRLDDALASFDSVLRLDPGHAISWNNRGNTLVQLKRFEDAVDSYTRALALKPDFTQASENRLNALFELRQTSRCPPAYMRMLFDDFASHYDDTMLNKLEYRGHQHLRTLAERAITPLEPGRRILDLGMGTGLVGEVFRDIARGGRLDGVDLAPRMIEAARRRGIYNDLMLGDLETILHETGAAYDLILAADTMIYLGDLSTTFAGTANRLEPGGFYLFAIESKDGSGWEQTAKNRFRHSEVYLREEAERAGLEFADIMPCTLRIEGSTPVPGFAVALKKPNRS